MDDLTALDMSTDMTMNVLIKIKQNNKTSFTRMNTIINLNDFYVESIVNHDTGYVIKKIDSYYYMYEVFRFEYKNYIRLAAIYEEPLDEWSEASTTTEFDKSWEYTYYEGIYSVKASFMSLFEIALNDQELLDEIIKEIPNDDLIMTIDLTDEDVIKMIITFEIEGVEATIEMTYILHSVHPIDLSLYTKLPVINPELLMTYSDLNILQENHLYDGMNPNYYLVKLEAGTYAIELSELMDITLYDIAGNQVILNENSNCASQDSYKGIYDLAAGEYIVKISSHSKQAIVYNFRMINLNTLYELS